MRYQKRISGPLLDRIDIHIQVPSVDYEKLSGDRLGEKSETIRARVEKARERQRRRLVGLGHSTSLRIGTHLDVRWYEQQSHFRGSELAWWF